MLTQACCHIWLAAVENRCLLNEALSKWQVPPRLLFKASQLLDATERTIALHSIREEMEVRKTHIFEANRQDLQVCFQVIISYATLIQ